MNIVKKSYWVEPPGQLADLYDHVEVCLSGCGRGELFVEELQVAGINDDGTEVSPFQPTEAEREALLELWVEEYDREHLDERG